MCTVMLNNSGDGTLWVAANRDEVLVRPAYAPVRWRGEDFVAPKDEVGGGTWLGLNASGLFVAVTNRFGAEKDERRESRGALVVEALRAKSATALHGSLSTLPAARFNAFHLVYSDGIDALLTWSDGAHVQQQSLGHGLQLVTERSLGAAPLLHLEGEPHGGEPERVRFLRARLAELGARPSAEALQALLQTHRPDAPLDSPCVHLPDFGYGTRSSLVLFKEREVGASDWRWAEPAHAPFVAQRFETLLHPQASGS